MSLHEMLCSAMGNTPKHVMNNLTGSDPFNDSHDENGSVQWLRNILKVQSIMRYPTDVRDALMKRYTLTICYSFMKNFNKMSECNYKVDLGSSINHNASVNCFGNIKNSDIVFTERDISNMNINNGFSTPVACYAINTISGDIVRNVDGTESTYWLNDQHKESGVWGQHIGPFTHHIPFVNRDNPIIASKFMNGGKSNTDILFDSCISNGMTTTESYQHIQTINELYGSIPIVDTDEEREQIRTEILTRFDANPIPNRKMDKTMCFDVKEMLYYIVQRIDNELVVKSLLASQYILDNHGTAGLIPALQKMYELFDSGISDVVSEKKHEDITHSEVVEFIDTTCNEIIANLNRNLKVDTCLELTDEMMNDVNDNCNDALIKQFIGDTLEVIEEINETPDETPTNDSNTTDDICQICQLPGGVPINIEDNDDYCKHSFHPFCLANWALSTTCSNNDCCPTCRKSFRY